MSVISELLRRLETLEDEAKGSKLPPLFFVVESRDGRETEFVYAFGDMPSVIREEDEPEDAWQARKKSFMERVVIEN